MLGCMALERLALQKHRLLSFLCRWRTLTRTVDNKAFTMRSPLCTLLAQVYAKLVEGHKSAVTGLAVLGGREEGAPDALLSCGADGAVALWEPSAAPPAGPDKEAKPKVRACMHLPMCVLPQAQFCCSARGMPPHPGPVRRVCTCRALALNQLAGLTHANPAGNASSLTLDFEFQSWKFALCRWCSARTTARCWPCSCSR
jgi:hypothetical protein